LQNYIPSLCPSQILVGMNGRVDQSHLKLSWLILAQGALDYGQMPVQRYCQSSLSGPLGM